MKLVAERDHVISYFSKNLSIVSASLLKIEIYSQADCLIIDLDLRLLYAKNYSLYRLRFINVKEYYLYHNSDHIFYNISTYKLLHMDGLYYLSLDPENESASRSTNDNDFILSKSVEAYLLSPTE
jgi:hypothetical protein